VRLRSQILEEGFILVPPRVPVVTLKYYIRVYICTHIKLTSFIYNKKYTFKQVVIMIDYCREDDGGKVFL
jgi:hypothetical protein